MDDSGEHKKKLSEPEGAVVLDLDLKITFFSREAEEITGFRADAVCSQPCDFLFRSSVGIKDRITEVLQSRELVSNQSLKIRTVEGDSIKVAVSIIPAVLSGDKADGVVLLFRDRRQRLALYDLLEEKTVELINERNKLEAIFNSRLEGTFTINKDCNITTFNRSAERITGFSGVEAIGEKCWDILKCEYCKQECPNGCLKKVSLREGHANCRELYITRKDGKRIPVRLTTVPLLDVEGNHIGAVETFQDITELKNLSNHLRERFRLHNIIGRSRIMEKIYCLIENVSKNDSTILITGESGTGKELVARSIHLNSYRRTEPFIPLNCSAFAETLIESELFGHEKGAFTGAVQTKQGRFELAQGGTLFLDEIGDISPTIQVKLLRVLETRQFERVGGTKPIKMDVRLIAAANKDLAEEVRAGRFREDFYYRINVINVNLPPLRERIEDLPLLIQHLIDKDTAKFNKNLAGISPEALKILQNYDWPGNIRELENVIEHAFVMCHEELIDAKHLPDRIREKSGFISASNAAAIAGSTLEDAEKSLIEAALKEHNGSRVKAAQALGTSKTTLWRKMKKYNYI